MPTTLADEVEFARWIASLDGWCFDNLPSFYAAEISARDALLAAGRIERGTRDRRPSLELTDAGQEWLAGQETL